MTALKTARRKTMDQIAANLSGHPALLGIVLFLALLILYFIFKKLVKLALLILLLLIALGGYFYFKDPRRMPENVMGTLEKAKAQTERMVEKGKDAYQTGKAVVETGKKLTEEISGLTGAGEKKTERKPEKGP